jgi:type I restriction enzyme S subunit
MSSDAAEMTRVVSAIPDDWREVTLGDIIALEYGRSLPDKVRRAGDVAVYGSNGVVGAHDEALVPTGGIIVGRKGTAGSVTVSPGPFWPIDTTYFVKARQTVDWDWLAATLHHARLNELNEATGVPGLNRDKAYRQPLLLPPLDEQRRIAEVLRSVDDAIAATLATNKQAQIALESARTNLLMPLADTTALGAVCNVIAGYAFKSTSFIESGVKVLRISNITEGGVDFSGRAVCVAEQDVRGLDRFRLRPLDTVVALSGATTGKMCVFTFDEPVYANQRVAFIRVKEGLADQGYINHVLSMLTASVRQSAYGGAQPNISTKEIAAMEIALPSLAEQHEIAEVLDGLSQSVTLGDQMLVAQLATKATLMSDLLSGRVRVPS